MNLHECTAELGRRVGQAAALGGTLKFDCGADGVAVIDGRSAPGSVDNADRIADCTVALTLDDLSALLAGELDPATGFMMGRLKVSGDMSLALKLQRLV
jgi:putative sterol carrier protein